MVTQDFFRRIDGYNRFFTANVNAQIVSGSSVSVSAPTGPGRVERGFMTVLLPTSTHFSAFPSDYVIITIDGVEIVNLKMYSVFPIYAGTPPLQGPYFYWKYIVDQSDVVSFVINVDYEVSCTFKLLCQVGAGNLYHQIGLSGRCGR